MKYFFYKLNPPRPTFTSDLNEAEVKIMENHVAYWTELANKRTAVAFGVVLDPKGGWGAAIVEIEQDTDIQSIRQDDPAILSGLGFSADIYPMPRVILRT